MQTKLEKIGDKVTKYTGSNFTVVKVSSCDTTFSTTSTPPTPYSHPRVKVSYDIYEIFTPGWEYHGGLVVLEFYGGDYSETCL